MLWMLYFEAAPNHRKPVVMSIAPIAHMFRSVKGLGLVITGWFVSHSTNLFVMGGIILISAFLIDAQFSGSCHKGKNIISSRKREKQLSKWVSRRLFFPNCDYVSKYIEFITILYYNIHKLVKGDICQVLQLLTR